MVFISSRGPKSDERDALGLAQSLRIGNVETRVHKKRGEFALLGHMTRAYGTLVTDTVRTQNRIGKPRRTRFRKGHTKAWKKAIVTLDPEHRIDFF